MSVRTLQQTQDFVAILLVSDSQPQILSGIIKSVYIMFERKRPNNLMEN